MLDAIAIVASIVLFGLAVAYTHGADSLKGPRS